MPLTLNDIDLPPSVEGKLYRGFYQLKEMIHLHIYQSYV